MSKLAVNGGKPLRDVKTNPWPKWPLWDEKEEKGLLEVLRSGVWSYNGPKELQFNRAFAGFIGAGHALSVANGTVSLQLALEACGIGLGDKTIGASIRPKWKRRSARELKQSSPYTFTEVLPTWTPSWRLRPSTICG